MKKAELLTTCFGLGKLPIAPGTWGSVLPVVLYQALGYVPGEMAPATTPIVMGLLIVAFSFICVRYSPAVIERTGKTDPGMIVADEVAGQALTMLIIALFAPVCSISPVNVCNTTVLGFVLFRIFDIFKPWPCRKLEKLPAGVGILADDLMAGFYAGAATILFVYLKSTLNADETAAGPMETNAFFAAILGAAQGLTEFLPVSSSGHLVLLEKFIPSLDPENEQMLLFDLGLHVATIGSIIIVFFGQIRAFFKNLFSIRKYGTLNPVILYQNSPAIRFCMLAIISTVTTAVCYKLFKDPLEQARKLPVLAVTWMVTAAVLFITDHFKPSRRGLRKVGIGFAIIVGIAQSVAILPGISRSGSTICVAILLGLHRQWAIEYSFLISIPAILGGALLEFMDQPDILSDGSLPAGFILTGMATALIFGLISLKWLVRASRKRKLKPFALYCLLLACFVLFYLLK